MLSSNFAWKENVLLKIKTMSVLSTIDMVFFNKNTTDKSNLFPFFNFLYSYFFYFFGTMYLTFDFYPIKNCDIESSQKI